MTRGWQKFSLIILATFAFAACDRLQPIYNVDGDPAPANVQKLSSKQIGKIIATTATAKGWTVNEKNPGHMQCTMQWQGHTAVIGITYSKKSYSIELDSSQNLMQSDTMIHRNYNRRVQDLQTAIDQKLSAATYN